VSIERIPFDFQIFFLRKQTKGNLLRIYGASSIILDFNSGVVSCTEDWRLGANALDTQRNFCLEGLNMGAVCSLGSQHLLHSQLMATAVDSVSSA
jgi:hypothetical protein